MHDFRVGDNHAFLHRSLILAASAPRPTHPAPEYTREIHTEFTTLIARIRTGDRDAEDRFYEHVYPELHRIARQRLSAERHAPESTESIVHECYLRLTRSELPLIDSRAHFFALVSRLMRQILVDRARARLAQRRDHRLHAPLAAAQSVPDLDAERLPLLLRLDAALTRLADAAPQAARLVELRFFGGLTVEECAELLSSDTASVRRDLRFGQSWLRREIGELPTE